LRRGACHAAPLRSSRTEMQTEVVELVADRDPGPYTTRNQVARIMINDLVSHARRSTHWRTLNPSASVTRGRNSAPMVVAAGFILASLAGCGTLSGYETEYFASADVRVIHSTRHCKADAVPGESEVPNADLVTSTVRGFGRLVASKRAWELQARQLATELDADIAVVRPCEFEAPEWPWEVTQTEIWRTRGYEPKVQEQDPAPGITFSAPDGASYGTRLQHLYTCLELAESASAQLSANERGRLPEADARDFFSSDPYFPGYAKIDRHYRPTRRDENRLSLIVSRRDFADQAAGRYVARAPEDRARFAEHYVVCLLDLGYRW
jgi:hypothetical protein